MIHIPLFTWWTCRRSRLAKQKKRQSIFICIPNVQSLTVVVSTKPSGQKVKGLLNSLEYFTCIFTLLLSPKWWVHMHNKRDYVCICMYGWQGNTNWWNIGMSCRFLTLHFFPAKNQTGRRGKKVKKIWMLDGLDHLHKSRGTSSPNFSDIILYPKIGHSKFHAHPFPFTYKLLSLSSLDHHAEEQTGCWLAEAEWTAWEIMIFFSLSLSVNRRKYYYACIY